MCDIALYYVISMLFVSLATGVQVWTLNLHYRGSRGQKIPSLLHFCSYFKKRLPAADHEELQRSSSLDKPIKERSDVVRGDLDKNQFNRDFGEPNLSSPAKRVTSILRGGKKALHKPAARLVAISHYKADLDVFEKRLSQILNAVCDMIEKSERRLTHLQEIQELTSSWQNVVAVIMDRILLTLFTVVIVTVFLVLYMRVSYDQ